MIDLIKHIEYHHWANGKTASQIENLSSAVTEKEFGGSFPSIRLTLLHLLQADYRWLHRLNGVPIVEVPAEWQQANVNTLLTTWRSVQDQLVSRVKELAGNENQIVKFVTAKGDPYEMALADVIAHLVNHGTYHRGQLVNMMRMAGEKPESTDYFIFVAGLGR